MMENTEQKFTSVPENESSQASNTAPIAVLFKDCLQDFGKLIKVMKDNDVWKHNYLALDAYQSKFRQWSSDTGASDRSLDHALRKSSQLQETTIDLLKELRSALSTTHENLRQAPIPLPHPPINTSPLVLPDCPDHLDFSRDSSDSDVSIQQRSEEIEQIVDCLVKLIPTLQDPAPQDIYRQHASQGDASHDIALAARMFPKATTELKRRLGYANWKRRQAYSGPKLQDHQNESPRQDLEDGRTRNIETNFSSISEMLKTDYRAAFSSHRTATGHTSDSGTQSVNDSVFSGSNYFSGKSVTSVGDSDQLLRLNIPKPPVPLRPDTKFDCPYCSQEIVFGVQIASDKDWAQHVFMDLEPYLCTFDDCLRANKSFGICDDWFQHELDSHRLIKVWSCHACGVEFDKKEHIQLHLNEHHKTAIDASDLSDIISLCERYSEKQPSDQQCPCCWHLDNPLGTLKDHLADHLEQFALTSIQGDDAAPVIDGKLKLLGEFITEQQSLVWAPVVDAKPRQINELATEQPNLVLQPTQGPSDDGRTDSNLFVDDSDEEFGRNLKAPEEKVEVANPGPTMKRPPMQRRGDSWMTKVKTYLEKQTVDRVEKDPWKTKVETYLENQSIDNESQVASRPFHTKPTTKNQDFTGRDSDLSRIHEILSVPGSMCILSGAGGMGKTAVANEYTYRYDFSYKYIFWVSAETTISCADTYSLIATQLVIAEDDPGIEQGRLITLSREFLEQTEARWLLVFDNVNSWSDIEEFIPTDAFRTPGSILITTRKQELEGSLSPPKCHHVELGPLTLEESRQLLLLSMESNLGPRGSNSGPRDLRSHPEYKLASEIAILAERMPLALAHIAGYVQVSKCTLTDFVHLWNERHRHAGRSSQNVVTPNLSTHKVLETVWNIGLREVTMDARELLNILAFLDSETIQRNLLVGEHEESSLEFLHSDQAFRYKRMIIELSHRRLIEVKIQDDEEILSVHRSLQGKILEDLNKNARQLEEVFSQVFSLVRKRFPLPSPVQVPEPAKWPACKEYLPHVLHLQHVTMNLLPSLTPSVRLARLLSDGGINLWERGMTEEGLRLLRSAEAILNNLECEENQLRANIHVIIALLVQDHGLVFVKESRDRIQKALQIREDYLEQTEPSSYTRNDEILLHNARSDFGCVLLQYGKYTEAEPIFQSCMAKYQEWGTVRDIPYEYYKFNHHTAFCRLYHQDFVTAIRLAEESLRCITLATGQSSATNKTRFDLACIILQSGDLDRALALHKEVLEIHLKSHGKSSFLTLQSYYAVGAVSAYVGNLVDGEHYMRTALTLHSSRPCAWPQAAIARTQFHLSQILVAQSAAQGTTAQDLASSSSDEAQQLATQAIEFLEGQGEMMPLEALGEVREGDELARFDYVQPIFDGRFTGRGLLGYVAAVKNEEEWREGKEGG